MTSSVDDRVGREMEVFKFFVTVMISLCYARHKSWENPRIISFSTPVVDRTEDNLLKLDSDVSDVQSLGELLEHKVALMEKMGMNGGEDTCGVATKSWFLGGILENWKNPRFLLTPLEYVKISH